MGGKRGEGVRLNLDERHFGVGKMRRKVGCEEVGKRKVQDRRSWFLDRGLSFHQVRSRSGSSSVFDIAKYMLILSVSGCTRQ